jgi:hypothetical protein
MRVFFPIFFEKNLILYQIFNFRVTKLCQSLKKIKKYFFQSLILTISHKKPFCVGLSSWWMIIKISGIQIFTEIKISIFEKVVHFVKNRIKKWEHPKFSCFEKICLTKDQKKFKKYKLANLRQWVWKCHFWWFTWYEITLLLFLKLQKLQNLLKFFKWRKSCEFFLKKWVFEQFFKILKSGNSKKKFRPKCRNFFVRAWKSPNICSGATRWNFSKWLKSY